MKIRYQSYVENPSSEPGKHLWISTFDEWGNSAGQDHHRQLQWVAVPLRDDETESNLNYPAYRCQLMSFTVPISASGSKQALTSVLTQSALVSMNPLLQTRCPARRFRFWRHLHLETHQRWLLGDHNLLDVGYHCHQIRADAMGIFGLLQESNFQPSN